MLSKARISLIKSLEHKKYRQNHGLFVAEGSKIVNEIIHSHFEIKHIYATSGWINDNLLITNDLLFELVEVTQAEVDKISFLSTPSQVMAVVKIPVSQPTFNHLFQQPAIILDEIRDPGNLGTIIRTAAWFGIPHIICSEGCVDVFNPKTVQSTMGSISRVQVFYTDLEKLLLNLPENQTVYAATMDGENLYNIEIPKNPWIVIGNESNGISESVRNLIKRMISIPRYGESVESLNASVATAIICSELKRQGAF